MQGSVGQPRPALLSGGPGGIRTLDLRVANAALSQLSYKPEEQPSLLYIIIYLLSSGVDELLSGQNVLWHFRKNCNKNQLESGNLTTRNISNRAGIVGCEKFIILC